MSGRYLILQGPNLDRLGQREPRVYGTRSLEDIHSALADWAASRRMKLDFRQSADEGELIALLREAAGQYDGVVFNPAAFSHSSVPLRDCLADLDLPVIEVHLSNIHAREAWRSRSLTGAFAAGVISGLGEAGYRLALAYLSEELGKTLPEAPPGS